MKQKFCIITLLSLFTAIIFNSLGISLNHKYAQASFCFTILFFAYSIYMLCFKKWTKIKNQKFLTVLKHINKSTRNLLTFNILTVIIWFVCNICVGDSTIGTLQFYHSNSDVVYNVCSLSYNFSTFTTLFIMFSGAYQLNFCRVIKTTSEWIDDKARAEEH